MSIPKFPSTLAMLRNLPITQEQADAIRAIWTTAQLNHQDETTRPDHWPQIIAVGEILNRRPIAVKSKDKSLGYSYIEVDDDYQKTIIHFRNAWRVSSVGDLFETYGAPLPKCTARHNATTRY